MDGMLDEQKNSIPPTLSTAIGFGYTERVKRSQACVMKAKYLNPYTDFGFKKLFGEEASKELLVDFLNQLLPPHHQITTLQFKHSEKLNDTPLCHRT